MLLEITSEDAVTRLNRPLSSIQKAVQRGVFTLSPRSNSRRHLLYQDQIDLFQGKELSLTALSTKEYEQWLAIESQATTSKGQAATLQEALDRLLHSPKRQAVAR